MKAIAFVTGRNEVLAKVIFLHRFVILFTGGGYGVWQGEPPQAWRTTPRTRPPHGMETPQAWRTPPPAWRPPRGHGEPPWTRPPLCMETPPGEQTPAYGLRSAGTHPTGMHSCYQVGHYIHELKRVSKDRFQRGM